MITFSMAIVTLIIGYVFYGRYVSRVFGISPSRPTPAITKSDGVDYVVLPTWKAFMVQFLNIAGLGPIFGAIMGAKFGIASYLWIVFGTIFAGATHDFVSGMMSLRNGGMSLPLLVGHYLGKKVGRVMILFTLLLLILVGAVFVSQPADLLAMLTPKSLNASFWIVVIFIYYFIATMFSVDKLIGKIYPLFAIALLFMAGGIMVMLYVKHPVLPEIWNGLHLSYEKQPIFPMMFISIACGAISGFHATQSPLMARCLSNEKHARSIFYGAMVAEGIVALVWAAAATAYFQENGTADAAGKIVMNISKGWLGPIGGILAVLGVVFAPITSGDTALRSARLIVADALHVSQKRKMDRLKIAIPIFLLTFGFLLFSLLNKDGFSIIWRYFSWCNQTLSVFTLWACTSYLMMHHKNYHITMIPAVFMTFVVNTYICIAPEGFHLSAWIAYAISGVITLAYIFPFLYWKKNMPDRMPLAD